MSATCHQCGQVMDPGVACTKATYGDFADGITRERIPYRADAPHPCRDCGTPPGGLHHPGCDNELCPGCREQAISCDCAWWWDEVVVGDVPIEVAGIDPAGSSFESFVVVTKLRDGTMLVRKEVVNEFRSDLAEEGPDHDPVSAGYSKDTLDLALAVLTARRGACVHDERDPAWCPTHRWYWPWPWDPSVPTCGALDYDIDVAAAAIEAVLPALRERVARRVIEDDSWIDRVGAEWSADCTARGMWAPWPPRSGGRTAAFLAIMRRAIAAHIREGDI